MRPTALAAAAVLLCGLVCIASADESIVKTSVGAVQGVVYPTYRAFYSVPYVEPPVGALRWATPVPIAPWNGLWNATFSRPGCPQVCQLPPHTCPLTQSEDCLHLNIFTPRVANQQTKLPVAVFFPGGNFRQGGIGTPLYEGGPMVATGNIILVTAAYRLGTLGFLAFGATRGNYGIMDQQEALRWVKANIAAFGGDPDNISIFGQSAGASSVAVHLTAPSSFGLYNKVIMQSDPLALPLKTPQDQAFIGSKFASSLGCNANDMNCLRSKSVDDIINAQQASQNVLNIFKPIELFYPWVPTIDGEFLSMQPIDAFQQGKYNKVPIMLGSVSEEAYIFIFMASSKPMSDLEYAGALVGIFGLKESGKVGPMYPPPLFGDKRPTLGVVGTDLLFSCSGRNVSSAFVSSNPNPIFTYVFNHTMTYDAWGPEFAFCVGHVCHGADLPFSFGIQQPGVFQMTPPEQQMSLLMMQSWTNFFHSGNPNNGPSRTALTWVPWSESQKSTMYFQTPSTTGPYWRQNYCDFWDQQGFRWGF